MKTPTDIHERGEGEGATPGFSTPPILLGGATIVDRENEEEDTKVFRDLEDNSPTSPTAIEENTLISEEETSNFDIKAPASSPFLTVSSEERTATKISARKEKKHKNVSKGRVDTTDTSCLSPGAVLVQGSASSFGNLPDQNELSNSHGHDDDGVEEDEELVGTDEDHLDQDSPSLIVTARLVPDDQLAPEFVEEHLERRIQEGVESRLRAVVAEAIVPTTVSAGTVNQKGQVSPRETTVCGLKRTQLLIVIFFVVAGAVVTGVAVSLSQSGKETKVPAVTSPTVAPTVPPTAAPTVSPTITASPTQPFQVQLEQWIIRTDEDRALFENSSSPQSRALEWLSADNFTRTTRDLSPRDVLERYVLAVVYFSTNGPNWLQQDVGYLTEAHVCSWNNNITDPSDSDALGAFCFNGTSVDNIWLDRLGLSGTIPWELSLLSNMISLYWKVNSLTGSIPTELGRLSLLDQLEVNSNQLEGSIPTEIGLLTALTVLDFSTNSFTGTMPTEFGALTGLMFLYVNENELTGTLPNQLGQLGALQELWIDNNSFTGTLPTELGQMTSLKMYQSYENQFTGTLPTEVGQMTSLYYLDFATNTLTGTIPTEFGTLFGLMYFYVNDNRLTGTLPIQLGQLTVLEALWIDGNFLSGTLPTEVGQMTSLQFCRLYTNQFTGTLPSDMGVLINLQGLYVSDNQLNGTLPAELSQLTALIALDVNKNSFTGTLPTELGQLTGLLDLWLHDNSFSGTLPTELGRLTNLTSLSMGDNNLTGTIPTELGLLGELVTLYAYANNLTGTFPTELGLLTGLSLLSLYENALMGTLPTELGQLIELQTLSISINNITGSLPTELSELENLENFWFDKNNLTGSVNDTLCADTTTRQWVTLQGDCLVSNRTMESEIDCPCCTTCCNSEGEDCQLV